MIDAELPEPVFKESEFMFYVTLKNKNCGNEDSSWDNLERVAPKYVLNPSSTTQYHASRETRAAASLKVDSYP